MFGKKNQTRGRARPARKHKTLKDMQEGTPEQNMARLESDVASAVVGTEAGQNGFFCTDEPFIERMDDGETIAYVRRRLPDIGAAPGSQAFKQAVFDFLEDDAFVRAVMERFGLDARGLFKVVFRLDPSAFKGMFMKRVKEIAARKSYYS